MDMKRYFEKYRDVLPFAFFGILTTAVNVIVYWALAHLLNAGTMLSTFNAWIAAVLFAYVTNRKWVFHSEAVARNQIIKEMFSFFAARLATGIVDWVCMYIFVECMHLNDTVVKILANILVIIMNYVASKCIVFKKSNSN